MNQIKTISQSDPGRKQGKARISANNKLILEITRYKQHEVIE
jgi:hypothetical protein